MLLFSVVVNIIRRLKTGNVLTFEKLAKRHNISNILHAFLFYAAACILRVSATSSTFPPSPSPPAIFIRYFSLRNVITVCTAE